MKFIDIPAIDLDLRQELIDGFAELIQRGDFILGDEVAKLEEEMCQYLHVNHAIAVSSGTDALFLALKSLDFPQGSEVITTPYTFFATTEAIINAGLIPVYVDIDRYTYNIDPKKIIQAITSKTKAILPVHLFGQPARMDQVIETAHNNELKIVEDCAQAFGAKLNMKLVGTFGDLGCFSFYPTKNLGAYGDAGLIATNNPEYAQKIRILRNQGSKDPYRHEVFGINSRCDTIQAMILRKKLPFTDMQNEQRRKTADIYRNGLTGFDNVIIPLEADDEYHVYHQFTIQLQQRDNIKRALSSNDIPTAIYYDLPLHLQPAAKKLGYKQGDFPEAENVSRKVLSLPIAPHLTDTEIRTVISAIRNQLMLYV